MTQSPKLLPTALCQGCGKESHRPVMCKECEELANLHCPPKGDGPAHTPEPWSEGTAGGAIVADKYADGRTMDSAAVKFYGGGALVLESCNRSDRRRILACMAFCRNLSTEGIEAMLGDGRVSGGDQP